MNHQNSHDDSGLFAPDGFQAVGVKHQDDQANWHVLISHQDEDLWLTVLTTTLPPTGFVLRDEDEVYAAKLVALLGMPWYLLEADFAKFVDWQADYQRHLPHHVNRSLEEASLDEVREWRERVQDSAGGELIRAVLTGDQPWAVSN